jgi:hypothetical protein
MKMLYIIMLSIILTLFISCKKEIEKPNDTTNSGTLRFVTANDGINLREAPDQDGKVVTLIPIGSEVKIIEERWDTLTLDEKTGKWTKVEWKEFSGWAFGGFLSESKPQQSILHLSNLTCGKIINAAKNYCWPADMKSIKKLNWHQAKEYCGNSGLPSKNDFIFKTKNKFKGGFWTSDESGERAKIFEINISGSDGGDFSEMTADKSSLNYVVCK